MVRNPHITISAAGQGSRIREAMTNMGYPEDLPKSLLPTGAGETLLGRITRQAMEVGHVMLYVNYDHVRTIGESPDMPSDISLLINRNVYGPLGPIYLDLARTGRRCMMAAGDFWAEFEWSKFLAFHESHHKPVSILVGPSVPTKGGAKFHVAADGTVQSWERVEHTTADDLINIGAYIIDPEKAVLQNIASLAPRDHKEDPFNDMMIRDGLMAAYVLKEPAFNVNNEMVYKELARYTRDRPVVRAAQSGVK